MPSVTEASNNRFQGFSHDVDMDSLIQIVKKKLVSCGEEDRLAFSKQLSSINFYDHTVDASEQYSEIVINKENKKTQKYITFLQSSGVNGIITAPTQVGKSQATKELIQECFRQNMPVIVSTDNKTDQLEQLYNRIEADLAGADVRMLKVGDKGFGEDLKNVVGMESNRFVIFCLDNAVQIEKLITTLVNVHVRNDGGLSMVKKICVIHDEGDVVSKDNETIQLNEEQAASHRKWLELFTVLKMRMGEISAKRVFVTATPENCCMLYDIQAPNVIKLEVPRTYTGYRDISYINLPDDLAIAEVLAGEVSRIKETKSNEAILYCIDRKKSNGQDIVLKSLSTLLDCIVHTYNGDGIRAHVSSPLFSKVLDEERVVYHKSGNFYNIKGKHISIRKFYSICQKMGETAVVTIGKDLICRGISYVSEDKLRPIAASVMIYKPGQSMHAVGLCQTIGRITGTARPDLERKLYAPRDVFETYISYNKNQEKWISEVESSNKGNVSRMVIDGLVFEHVYKRSTDRPKLKLNMNFKKDSKETETETENEESEMRKMVDLWWGADTIIGDITRFVYQHVDGVTEQEMKSFLKNKGADETWYSDLHQPKKRYTIIFKRSKDRKTKLSDLTRNYIEMKNK